MPDNTIIPPSQNVEQLELPYASGSKCEICDKTSNDPNDFIYDQNQRAYCTDHCSTCENCGEIKDNDDIRATNRGTHLCSDCYNNEYMSCPNCEQEIDKSDYLKPNSRNRYSMKYGGCTECSTRCENCKRVVDNDSICSTDGDSYCEDCYSDLFTTCSECDDAIPSEDAIYDEHGGNTYCPSCYKEKFALCNRCHDNFEKTDMQDLDGESYCQNCYDIVSAASLEEYKPLIENFSQFSFSKKDRSLDKLLKLVPISVRELKAKYASLAASLADMIVFANGKTITAEIVQQFREKQGVENFPVEYSTWTELQRSLDKLENKPFDGPQLVLKIIASDIMLDQLKSDPSLYDLFDKINTISKESTHPYSKDQIGWARLELDPDNNFILVDEIQCDHQNAAFKLKTSEYGEIGNVKRGLKSKYRLDEAGINNLLDKYIALMKNFPDIATQAISNFARSNGFKKLYWHTYESGKKLKENSPPRSLYEKVPKENFFEPTEEMPFGLPGKFFQREAAVVRKLNIAARKIQFNQLIKR